MNAKQFIKNTLPIRLRRCISAIQRSLQDGFTWEGVYPHRGAVPTECGAYDDERCIRRLVSDAREGLDSISVGQSVAYTRHAPLSMLGSLVLQSKNRLRILDFGGGAGAGFVELLARLNNTASIEYHVVDFEKVCLAGQQLFSGDDRINFHNNIPPIANAIDIIYTCGVLPYIDDYKELLQRLCTLSSKYLLFTDLAAGSFQSYATRQLNLTGQVLAYWFLNLDEVISVVEAYGYSCIYNAPHGGVYNQDNFPESLRIGRMRCLLFARKQAHLTNEA